MWVVPPERRRWHRLCQAARLAALQILGTNIWTLNSAKGDVQDAKILAFVALRKSLVDKEGSCPLTMYE
jgi:hypothetical protein